MSNEKSSVDLRDRALTYAKEIIHFVKPLQKDALARPLINQLIRSTTGVGSNFIEAKNASSKKAFRNKVYISKKEASESLYWLSLFEEFTDSIKLKKLKSTLGNPAHDKAPLSSKKFLIAQLVGVVMASTNVTAHPKPMAVSILLEQAKNEHIPKK